MLKHMKKSCQKNTKYTLNYQEKKEALYNLSHSLHHFRNQTLEKFEFAVFLSFGVVTIPILFHYYFCPMLTTEYYLKLD